MVAGKNRTARMTQKRRIRSVFFVEAAGVELSKIQTDNQQYIQTQKLAPTKTPSVCCRIAEVK